LIQKEAKLKMFNELLKSAKKYGLPQERIFEMVGAKSLSDLYYTTEYELKKEQLKAFVRQTRAEERERIGMFQDLAEALCVKQIFDIKRK
jgi:C-terminal processing protease CtpA/Prc